MDSPSEPQINLIKKLVTEKKPLLEPKPDWLVAPTNKREASALINSLMGLRAPDPDPGFYVSTNGAYVLVYTTRSGHIATKTWDNVMETWAYTGRAGLSEAHTKMTGEQAAALGRKISKTGTGMCIVCLAEGRDPTLTDERSIAVGYGQICANRYGWHYPSKDEAETILAAWA